MIIVVVSIVCNPDPFVEESWLRKGQVQSLSRMMPMNATDMMQFTTVYGLHEGHTAVFRSCHRIISRDTYSSSFVDDIMLVADEERKG
jgi:hypothetical protein